MNRNRQKLLANKQRKANELVKQENKQKADTKKRIAREAQYKSDILARTSIPVAYQPKNNNRNSSNYMQGFITDISLLGMLNAAVREVLPDDNYLLTDGKVIEHNPNE